MKFSVYQVSRRGGREKNEDRMGYCYTRDAGLFALADGMGGHPEGEMASQLALQTLASLFQREARSTLRDPLGFLNDGLLAGHRQLLRYATQRSLIDTPRTTIVACVIQGGVAYWAHCGDSRLYLVRGDKLIARTRDHSYSELHSAGRAPSGKRPINRNVLFSCLGTPGRPVVEVTGPVLLQAGDRLLLCSDGLWGTLPDELITRQLASRAVEEVVPELVEQALRRGGPKSDNVTVLAVQWDAVDDEDASGAVATQALESRQFASTIQAGALADERRLLEHEHSLDEAEIDRSIREINEAIRRGANRQRG